MNQGRIWCVVNPTVGLPLFLGSVAVTSLIVHFSVLSNTTWFGSYWNGGKAKVASVEGSTVSLASADGAQGVTIKVAPVAQPGSDTPAYVITVSPPGTQVAAAETAATDQTLALASPAAR